ncbi:MAG: hypothetical protein AAFR67_00075 [Chloroflexota bacterium]
MILAGDHVQVLVDGYDLTGDHNKIVVNDVRKMLATPVFGEAVEKYIPGQRQPKLEHNGYLNPAAGRSHPVLNGVLVDGVVSVLLGQNTAPAVGDPIYNLMTQQEQYASNPMVGSDEGSVVPFAAMFSNRRGARAGWGVALAVPVDISDSTNGATVDNGAESTNGGAAFLHILTAPASDTYSIEVEGSSNGSTWGNIATFTLDGSAIGSDVLALNGTLPRYLRYKATRSGSAGDTLRLAVAVVRY